MDRRMRRAVITAVVAMVVLVLAASSGPIDVWHVPTSGGSSASVVVTEPPPTTAPQNLAPTSRRDWPGWVGTLLSVIVAVLAAVAVVAALSTLRFLRLPLLRMWSPLRRRPVDGAALPEIDEPGVTLDVDAARAALVGGTPRNAIVACWMQLERDATTAGLPRVPSETPTEYAERVIGASSVDPRPISELASLYREARFSRHEMADTHRVRAIAALDRVAAALQHDAQVTT